MQTIVQSSLKQQRAAQKVQKQQRATLPKKQKPLNKWQIKHINQLEQSQKKQWEQARIHAIFQNGDSMSVEKIQKNQREEAQAIADLVYLNNITHATFEMEFMIQMAKILHNTIHVLPKSDSQYFASEYIKLLIDESEINLKRIVNEPELSPNQRRELLKPMTDLSDHLAVWIDALPVKLINEIITANTASTAYRFIYELYHNHHPAVIASIYHIAKGETFRSCAKKYHAKENDLREQIMIASKYLYKAGKCAVQDLKPITSVTELRQGNWLKIASHSAALTLIGNSEIAMTKFAQKYGILMFDLQKSKQVWNENIGTFNEFYAQG